jgi:hypothetical protein
MRFVSSTTPTARKKPYVQWIRRHILFHNKRRHPAEMGADKLQAFLTHLAVNDRPSSLHSRLPITQKPIALENTNRIISRF